MNYKLTLASGNRKTGPIPVSITSRDSCPTSCPFRGNGCYAEQWPLRLHWDAVDSGESGGDLAEFCKALRKLPHGQLWRMNQAGDLPGDGDTIDVSALGRIVAANRGRRGFTYTHKPIDNPANLAAVRMANDCGFTVNVSANSPREAAAIRKANPDLPTVCVLPSDHTAKRIDVDGVAIVTCPATIREDVTCATCGLCQLKDRPYVIGFPAHGTSRRKVDAIARGDV